MPCHRLVITSLVLEHRWLLSNQYSMCLDSNRYTIMKLVPYYLVKHKYPPFPLFSYFSVFVCLRCLLHHILSLIVYTVGENWEFVFISIVQIMMSANSRICFGLLIVFVSLYITPSHYHHCANFVYYPLFRVRS